jgi:hypothetical protein
MDDPAASAEGIILARRPDGTTVAGVKTGFSLHATHFVP